MKTDFHSLRNQVSCVAESAQFFIQQVSILVCLMVEIWEANQARKMFNEAARLPNEKPSLEPLMTRAQVAAYLKVTEASISNWIARAGFPVRKVGADFRFDRSAVDAWTVRHRKTPKQKRSTMQKLQNATAPTKGATTHVSL